MTGLIVLALNLVEFMSLRWLSNVDQLQVIGDHPRGKQLQDVQTLPSNSNCIMYAKVVCTPFLKIHLCSYKLENSTIEMKEPHLP